MPRCTHHRGGAAVQGLLQATNKVGQLLLPLLRHRRLAAGEGGQSGWSSHGPGGGSQGATSGGAGGRQGGWQAGASICSYSICTSPRTPGTPGVCCSHARHAHRFNEAATHGQVRVRVPCAPAGSLQQRSLARLLCTSAGHVRLRRRHGACASVTTQRRSDAQINSPCVCGVGSGEGPTSEIRPRGKSSETRRDQQRAAICSTL